jgi:hypothetical protein
MGSLAEWMRRWFRGGRSTAKSVPFLDVSGRIIQIPSSELRPGMIQVRCQGTNETVWAFPAQFNPSEVRHPPFEEDVLAYIRDIRETFLEHRPMSLDEWEDGFRRDANPLQEIAIWSHAADVYRAFGTKDTSPERRKDIYRIIVTCLATTPDTVWQTLELKVLSRREATRIVRQVYGKHA